MELKITNLDGKAGASVTLSDEIFGLEPRKDLIFRCIRWQLAKRRAGTHKVKNRAEIWRTGKKLTAQKGSDLNPGSLYGVPVVRSLVVNGELVTVSYNGAQITALDTLETRATVTFG